MEKFSYDNYLAISAFVLLSYVVGVDTQLSEYYNFFWLRWAILGIPPPYKHDGQDEAWQSGKVAEWQNGRGSLAGRVFQGQDDSRFSFLSASLLIYLSLNFPPVPCLHSDHLFVFPIYPSPWTTSLRNLAE